MQRSNATTLLWRGLRLACPSWNPHRQIQANRERASSPQIDWVPEVYAAFLSFLFTSGMQRATCSSTSPAHHHWSCRLVLVAPTCPVLLFVPFRRSERP